VLWDFVLFIAKIAHEVLPLISKVKIRIHIGITSLASDGAFIPKVYTRYKFLLSITGICKWLNQ